MAMTKTSPTTTTTEQENTMTATATRSILAPVLEDRADLTEAQREAVLAIVEDVARGTDHDVDVRALEKGYTSPVRLVNPRVVVRSIHVTNDPIAGIDGGEYAVTIDAADYGDPGRAGFFPKVKAHRDITALEEYGEQLHRSHERHGDGYRFGQTGLEHGGLSVVGISGKRSGGWSLPSGIYATPWEQILRVAIA
jgi:hypothetical protein